MNTPNHGNGGETDKYTWVQTQKDLTIYINIDSEILKNKIDVNVTSNILFVKIHNNIIINNDFLKTVKVENYSWYISNDKDGRFLIIEIDKFKEEWWNSVLKNDIEKIDISKIISPGIYPNELNNVIHSQVDELLYKDKIKMKNIMNIK